MGSYFHSVGAVHDARVGAVLWRHGPFEERAEHDDDELLVPFGRAPAVGARRVQPVV